MGYIVKTMAIPTLMVDFSFSSGNTHMRWGYLALCNLVTLVFHTKFSFFDIILRLYEQRIYKYISMILAYCMLFAHHVLCTIYIFIILRMSKTFIKFNLNSVIYLKKTNLFIIRCVTPPPKY